MPRQDRWHNTPVCDRFVIYASACFGRLGDHVDLNALASAVYVQRQERMVDSGPSLRGVGSARFQINGSLLSVGMAQTRPGKADEFVGRIVRYARDRWLGISWVYIAGREDPQLVTAFQTYGFRIRESLHLMGRLGALIEPSRPAPGVTVTPIRTFEEMQTYERISTWGFSNQPHPSREQILARARERWDEQLAQWYHYYLGWLNGDPAGGAYVSQWEQVPTIYGVVTAPPAQRHGVAGQVMIRLVRDTLARGFPWTCLYVAVGNPAERIYRSLGYSVVWEQTAYQWGDSRW